jgi:phosphonate transport system ATP-binding protein
VNISTRQFEVAADSRPAAISVRQLAKSFEPGKRIFAEISFDVAPGSIVALIGANGAGKSTLLRCLPRLIEPDTGEVLVQGRNILSSREALKAARPKMGFVFQKHNLVGRLSSLTNVVHGAQARGFGIRAWSQRIATATIRSEAMACLARVGLVSVASQRADSLSGGQSQRVAIARALMQRPEIVLADEPAASLDPQAGEEVMELFVTLMREEAKTVLFTSHNLQHAIAYADRVIALGGGRIVLDMPTASLTEQELRHLYV